eukprot:2593274-Rhodomonas_salina.1
MFCVGCGGRVMASTATSPNVGVGEDLHLMYQKKHFKENKETLKERVGTGRENWVDQLLQDKTVKFGWLATQNRNFPRGSPKYETAPATLSDLDAEVR